jgi:hypothetical protein
VLADLAMGNIAALRRLDDLDGVFDSDDLILACLVQVGDERGARGGLARTDRAGAQNQAVVVRQEFPHRFRVSAEAEFLERAHLGGHHAVGSGRAPAERCKSLMPARAQPMSSSRNSSSFIAATRSKGNLGNPVGLCRFRLQTNRLPPQRCGAARSSTAKGPTGRAADPVARV